MIDLRHFPVIKILVPFSAGVVVGIESGISPDLFGMLFSCFILWLALPAALILSRHDSCSGESFFGLAVLLAVFWTGVGTGISGKPLDPGLPLDRRIMVCGRIRQVSEERQGKHILEMKTVLVTDGDSVYNVGTILKAYLSGSSVSELPHPGEFWQMTGRLSVIRSSGNPGEPDYASLMRMKGIWYRFYCDTFPSVNYPAEGPGRSGLRAPRIRAAMALKWEGPPETVALLKAVCLGDRSGLSASLRESYSHAGGMHVLAVSGLHVGLIWWVLNRAFSFLVRIPGRDICRVVLVATLLWFYAFITGFSPSVCRAVTMFSFISAARLISHRGHPVNAIFVSAFFLLAVQPAMIMNVGFQLSYAAVLSIVTIQPVLAGWIRPRNLLLKWAWEASCVSLAAQAGTLPLVINYFQQVPVYALITNLLAIPLLSCIIGLFVVSVPLSAFGFAGPITKLMILLGSIMNGTMEAIALLPGAVIGNLCIEKVQLILLLGLLVVVTVLIRRPAVIPFLQSTFIIGLFVCYSAGSLFKHEGSSGVVAGNFSAGSMVAVREGTGVDCYLWCNDPDKVVWMDQAIESAWGGGRYVVSVIWVDHPDRPEPVSESNMAVNYSGGVSACIPVCKGGWMVGNNRYNGVVIAGNEVAGKIRILLSQEPKFLLLSHEPDIWHLLDDPLFEAVPEIVADGSNRRWYTDRLSLYRNLVHHTSRQGAWMTSY